MKREYALTISLLLFWGLTITPSLRAQSESMMEGAFSIEATSTLSPSSTATFIPGHLMDGTWRSWCEGVTGSASGVTIKVDLGFTTQLRYLTIKNGYGMEKYWEANQRIGKIRLSNEAGRDRIIDLKDTPGLQQVSLEKIVDDGSGQFRRQPGMTGRVFTLEILDVVEGTRWEDACLSEIGFNQWYYPELGMTDAYFIRNIFRQYFDGVYSDNDSLWITNDWGQWIKVYVTSNGHMIRELTSGDGTRGSYEYQLYINRRDDYHYMLEITEMQEPVAFEPEIIYETSFHYHFVYMDIFTGERFELDRESWLDLFEENPFEEVRRIISRDYSWEEVWLKTEGPELLHVVVPLTGRNEQIILTYRWNGTGFSLSRNE